jgi:hypothetical protein
MSTNGTAPRAWSLPSPRRVLLWIGIFTLFSLGGAAVYQYFHRNDTICRDKLPPVAQQDLGLGQMRYRCHDGQIVTK